MLCSERNIPPSATPAGQKASLDKALERGFILDADRAALLAQAQRMQFPSQRTPCQRDVSPHEAGAPQRPRFVPESRFSFRR